jgi:hypothetical protein
MRLRDHTHFRHTTLGRTPLDEWSARRRNLYLTTLTRDRHPCPRRDSNPRSQQASGRRPTPETARPLGSAFTNVLPHQNQHTCLRSTRLVLYHFRLQKHLVIVWLPPHYFARPRVEIFCKSLWPFFRKYRKSLRYFGWNLAMETVRGP